jgi:FkbM family methyltransferase
MVASDTPPVRPQGFRNVKEVRCNAAVGENACEGTFEYVPRLAGAIPPLVSAETQAACLANWTTASEAGSDRSRFDEDLLIYRKYFADRPADAAPGFFLELGGFDGLAETNTRFFEACLGWSGMLIEASPLSFEQLKANAPRRSNSDLLNVAPSCEKFEFVHLLKQTNTGISLHEAVYEGVDPLSWQVKAQCGPLSFYLQELGINTIDFLSLDVEAFEYYVLRTIDFKALDIKVLLVELSNRFYDSKTEKFDRLKEQVLTVLDENGFVEDTSIEVRSSKVFVKAG